MKNEIKYTKGELEDVEVIDDFLPPPEKLVKNIVNSSEVPNNLKPPSPITIKKENKILGYIEALIFSIF